MGQRRNRDPSGRRNLTPVDFILKQAFGGIGRSVAGEPIRPILHSFRAFGSGAVLDAKSESLALHSRLARNDVLPISVNVSIRRPLLEPIHE